MLHLLNILTLVYGQVYNLWCGKFFPDVSRGSYEVGTVEGSRMRQRREQHSRKSDRRYKAVGWRRIFIPTLPLKLSLSLSLSGCSYRELYKYFILVLNIEEHCDLHHDDQGTAVCICASRSAGLARLLHLLW